MSTSGSGFGQPDLDALTRLANQYFQEWPGKQELAAQTLPSSPPAPDWESGVPLGRTAAFPVSMPGEAELKAVLESLWSAATDAATKTEAPQGWGAAPQWAQTTPTPSSAPFGAPFDVGLIRQDFPILRELVNGRPLVWLDNAATTQKPQAVIDRLKYFYEHENSNIHRAAHELAARATDAYEAAREKVRGFLNASSVKEIVFVRGATKAINLVAQSWGRQFIGKDDEIVITWLEHHANIVPWQQLANEKGARLRVAPVDDNGQILLDEYTKLLGSKTRLVAFPQVSNALGTVTPARQMIESAHAVGAKVLLDGAQSVSHMPVNVQDLNPDWFVLSGHKIFAPTGIGVLYGKEALLNQAPPWQGGGNMITDVTFERSLFQPAPGRFEAGTGNIADAVGLGAALDYVTKIGLPKIEEYEHQLLIYATRLLKDIPGLRLIGTAPEKAGVLSFVIDGQKTEDIGSALNREGIAVRAGHHCAQPILRRFGVESTVRPSLAFYNTCEDIDRLITALGRIAAVRPKL
jgi:cysteine desulfurase/selenocysteine lyase